MNGSTTKTTQKLYATIKQLNGKETTQLLSTAKKMLNKRQQFTIQEKNHTEVTIIENENGSNFRIFVGNTPKMFTLLEITKMVRLCHRASVPEQSAKRLRAWLKNNRPDFFLDQQIGNNWDLVLLNMSDTLTANYIA